MKFDDFDNGTTEAIRSLRRDNTLTWAVALGLSAGGSALIPEITKGESAILIAVLLIGSLILQEVRRVRIDAVGKERAQLYQAFRAMELDKERY